MILHIMMQKVSYYRAVGLLWDIFDVFYFVLE